MMDKKIKNNMKAMLAVFGLICAFSTPVQADLNTGLIAHYSFDDCTAKDSSSNALDGTIIGNPVCVDGVTLNGVTNKALQFNGNDAIERLYSNIPAANFSVSVWVKATGMNSGIFAVNAGAIDASTGNDRHIFLSSGKFCQRVWSANPSDQNADGNVEYRSCTTATLTTGFNHLVYVVTPTNIFQYINGVLAKKIVGKPSEFDWQDRFFVGFSYDAYNQYFSGILDEFRYYNRVLSATEVKALYVQSIHVSGVMKGFNSTGFNVQCQNITTGQSVTLASVTFNCESAGLVVSPNDVIHINIDGKAK